MWVSQARSGALSFGADLAEPFSIVLIEVHAPKSSRHIPASLLRSHAAVEGQDRAGGEPALVAGEEQDAGRDLFRSSQPSQQLTRRERLAHRVRIGGLAADLGEIRRVRCAAPDRLAADAVADVVDGDG